MNEIKSRHDRAMDLAEQADLAKARGELATAKDLFRDALRWESEAARLCVDRLDLEPTRSVLHRSAAFLALECGELREAERLITAALAGNPPEEIAEELRDLFEKVYVERRLGTRGVSPVPREGSAPSVEVRGRLRFADSTGGDTGTIKLVDDAGRELVVIVPGNMMSDIVRPLWGSSVLVRGTPTDGGIVMEHIGRGS